MKRVFYFLLCFVLWGSAQAAQIEQIRLGRQSEKMTRVVVHLNKKADARVFALSSPYRIVIDFNDTVIDKDVLKTPPKPVSFIKDVRVGSPIAGQARLVMESATPVQFKEGFYLQSAAGQGSWRYVVDITSAGKAASAPASAPVTATSDSVLLPITPAKASTSYKSKVKKPLVVLDPGHGGADPGAISYSGKYEKNLTLQMAKEIRKEIEKEGKYRVLLTRDKDKALSLRERIAFAHNHEADLFISIHADSARNKKARGLSVYTISERASDREAQMLADRENKADIILGIDLNNESPEVSNILIDLAKRDTMDKSSHYANIVVDKMRSRVKLVKNAHRFAGFVVLKSPNIPSVLIEIGYLSNKQEESLLGQSIYRAKLASSIVDGINTYFNTLYE